MTKTGTPRAGRSDTKALILRAAEELFGERGFAATSARDVAERAGVKKALVFYHFESMERLFEVVLDRYYAAQATALENAFRAEGTLRERLTRLVDTYVEFIDAHRLFPRLVQQEVRGSGGPAVAKIERNLAALLEWTTRALGDVLPRSGPLSAKHFYLTFAGMVVQYYAYAPAIAFAWGRDPFGAAARRERREHLHWVVDALLTKLEGEAKAKRGR